jgi:hypothetical protein
MARQWPRLVMLRAHLLNSLQDGPVAQVWFAEDAAKDQGYTLAEIAEAAKALGVTSHKLDGTLYWVRPANLFAIWWGNRRSRRIPIMETCSSGGGAA